VFGKIKEESVNYLKFLTLVDKESGSLKSQKDNYEYLLK